MVKGWVYEAGKGVEQQKKFPDVIINSYIPKTISNFDSRKIENIRYLAA